VTLKYVFHYDHRFRLEWYKNCKNYLRVGQI